MSNNVVIVIPDNSKLIESNDYFYLVGNTIKCGTAVKCEGCSQWCISNSITILNFPDHVTTVKVQTELTDKEIYYNEDQDKCLCEDCDN